MYDCGKLIPISVYFGVMLCVCELSFGKMGKVMVMVSDRIVEMKVARWRRRER
jgi:hypothetical protein